MTLIADNKNNNLKVCGKRKVGKYWKLFIPEYFSADKQGCVYEHVYLYQEYHGCCMLPWGDVHHKDGNKSNNIIENLQGMTHQQHARFHMIGKQHRKTDMSNRFCLLCGSKTTYTDKKGCQRWLKYKDGFICNSCDCRNR